jgi:hypothetical protein
MGLAAAVLAVSGDASALASHKAPPLVLPSYQLPRSADVVRAAYQFAADHPEVLRYVPCYCGCDTAGHTSNEDCFVKSRAKNGDVTAWQSHGMVCAMCLAIGDEARQMYEAGASVEAIRAHIEQKYGNITGFRTPTPEPPAGR